MGIVYVAIEVGDLNDGDLESIPEAMVDTGAIHSMLPASLLDHLHVQLRDNRILSLADGSTAEYGLGFARIAIGGHDWPCPVIFGPEDHYLVGATTLEIFGLMVDPVGEQLIPRIYRARPF